MAGPTPSFSGLGWGLRIGISDIPRRHDAARPRDHTWRITGPDELFPTSSEEAPSRSPAEVVSYYMSQAPQGGNPAPPTLLRRSCQGTL